MDWELLARFFRLQRLLRQEVEARLGPLGLSGLEAWLLKVLSQRPYPSEAARAMGLPPPTVSHMVRRLERAGFLAREVDPEDLRRHRLRHLLMRIWKEILRHLQKNHSHLLLS